MLFANMVMFDKKQSIYGFYKHTCLVFFFKFTRLEKRHYMPILAHITVEHKYTIMC